jgi:hypothetical protein
MKSLIGASKNLKVSRAFDVFNEVVFDYSLTSINYGTQRQSGTFTIQYLVSPNPETGNTAPSITYDEIISNFDSAKAKVFRDAGLILFSCSYDQSDIITDPVSGSVSLSFVINIQIVEKTHKDNV